MAAAVENPLCFAEPPWTHPRRHTRRSQSKPAKNPFKLRSRSSPVRLADGAAPVRSTKLHRRPSVSPPNLSPSRLPSPLAELDVNYLYPQHSGESTTYKPAFFSKRPPPEPIRVIVVPGSRLSVPSALAGPADLAGPIDLACPTNFAGPTSLADSSDLAGPSATPPAPYTDATPTPPRFDVFTTTVVRNHSVGRRSSRRLVHGLLVDLMNNLPHAANTIRKPETKGIDTEVAAVASTSKKRSKDSQPLTAPADPAIPNEIYNQPGISNEIRIESDVPDDIRMDPVKPDDLRVDPAVPNDTRHDQAILGTVKDHVSPAVTSGYRNVAVQSHKHSSRKLQTDKTKVTREAQAESLEVPEEGWLGDVRALRDSHVRLVRRQLRHIAHLNRALDHVNRFPQPSHLTPSQPTHHSQMHPSQSTHRSQMHPSQSTHRSQMHPSQCMHPTEPTQSVHRAQSLQSTQSRRTGRTQKRSRSVRKSQE